jgi:hypothetical protein
LVRPSKLDQEQELHIIHEVFVDMIREGQGIAIKSVVGKASIGRGQPEGTWQEAHEAVQREYAA